MQMSVISSRSSALGSRSSALVIGFLLHALLILVTQAGTANSAGQDESGLHTSNIGRHSTEPSATTSYVKTTIALPIHESTEQLSANITNATPKISPAVVTTKTIKKTSPASPLSTTNKSSTATNKTANKISKAPTTPASPLSTTPALPLSTTNKSSTATNKTTNKISNAPTTPASPLSTTNKPPLTAMNETTNENSSTSTSPLSISITSTSSSSKATEIHENSPPITISTARDKATTANITIISLTTQSYNTKKATVLNLNTTTETETTTPVNIPTTHTTKTNTDTETHTSSQVSTQLSTLSTWVSPSSLKPNISTRKSTTSHPTQPPPSTNTKYCKVNEIFLSGNPTKQYIEIKKSETSTEVVYTIMFFSNIGKGTVCDRINGTSPYFISECSSVNLYEKLEKTGSVAIAVYRTNGEIGIKSKGLQDAVVLVFPGKSVSSTLRKLKQNNSYVEYDLKEKGDSSVSRCGDNFVQLQTSQASKGEKNSKCPQHGVHPIRNEPEKDNVKVTVAVVFSCLAVFLAIIVFSVIWIRRRNPGIRHLRLSSIGKDDDDDLILNMETVDEFEGETDDPTFKNSTYNCLKLK